MIDVNFPRGFQIPESLNWKIKENKNLGKMTPVSSGRRLAGENAVSSRLLRCGLVVKYTKAILPPKWKIITRDEYKGVSMKYIVHFNDILGPVS